MVFTVDQLDMATGTIKNPLQKITEEIDMTCFAQEEKLKPGQKFVYKLQGLIDHPKNETEEQD